MVILKERAIHLALYIKQKSGNPKTKLAARFDSSEDYLRFVTYLLFFSGTDILKFVLCIAYLNEVSSQLHPVQRLEVIRNRSACLQCAV
jgi:hypothetical protein